MNLILSAMLLLAAGQIESRPTESCIRSNFEEDCAKHVISWDTVPDEDLNRYRVEGYVGGTISWSVEPLATDTEYLVGCLPEDTEVRIWAIDHAGNWSEQYKWLLWEQGGGRMLDSSTMDMSVCRLRCVAVEVCLGAWLLNLCCTQFEMNVPDHCKAPLCGGP
jgi:hypothetical protein